MSKHFSDIRVQNRTSTISVNDLYHFRMKNVILSSVIGNCIRRVAGLDIPTYSVSPESFIITKNTSPWDKDRIIHQLSYLPLNQEPFTKVDLNMIELHIDVKNDTNVYRDVLSNEITFYDKEKKKNIDINNFLLYDDFLVIEDLGPRQELKLKCQFEYKTKRNSFAFHQAGTIGIDYKIEKEYPKDILFNITLHIGIGPKELILKSFDILIDRLQKMEKAIKNKDPTLFYIELNRNNRYDFVFIDEDHTIGSLIEKWNNHHDANSLTGYRLTTDRKSIKIDYGLSKFSKNIVINDNIIDNKLNSLIEKSLSNTGDNKEKEETIKAFLINVDRLRKYLTEIKTDFNKVKITNISVNEYMKDIEKNRVERMSR